MLCKLGGKSGSEDDVKAVLTAAGLEAGEEDLTKLMGDIEGKDINELLAEGAETIKDVPFGGRLLCEYVNSSVLLAMLPGHDRCGLTRTGVVS